MSISRRAFLERGAAFSVGFAALDTLFATRRSVAAGTIDDAVGYGDLMPDPAGLLDLPKGFGYTAFSRAGEEMSDGLFVPGAHDGMAAFPGPDGRVILVRNHELEPQWVDRSAFGAKLDRLPRIDRAKLYDYGAGTKPALGGTTTVVYDPKTKRLEKHFLSLAGTERNCAGGPTPWGTWLSCEETVMRKKDGRGVDHGFVFEVTPSTTPGAVDPVPLTAMGRFRHEAVAVDPLSGCVYLTEDMADGVLYRFIPKSPGRLRNGGRLQALIVRDKLSLDTKNWATRAAVRVHEPMAVGWIDLENVLAPEDDLRFQAAGIGAAVFARCEGMWYGGGSVYFAATTGGEKKLGQIWKYTPSPDEGKDAEEKRPATLELWVEPNDGTMCNNADNLTVSRGGELVVCEDGEIANGLFGVSRDGKPYRLAMNRASGSELAGATFSPDGKVLFVNVQNPGTTFAVHGPWR